MALVILTRRDDHARNFITFEKVKPMNFAIKALEVKSTGLLLVHVHV